MVIYTRQWATGVIWRSCFRASVGLFSRERREHALRHPHTAHSTHTPLPTLTVSLRRYLHYEPACAPRKHAFLVYVSPVHYDALGVPPPP